MKVGATCGNTELGNPTGWPKSGAFVRNEYGERVPIEELEDIITNREWRGKMPHRNYVDGRHCIGHGEGTWDYIVGEFS